VGKPSRLDSRRTIRLNELGYLEERKCVVPKEGIIRGKNPSDEGVHWLLHSTNSGGGHIFPVDRW